MKDGREPPLAGLLERWVAGDAAAGDEIYRRYYDRAWRFAMKLAGREVEADDIAQIAMAEGLEGIKAGARPDRFTQWIIAIVQNTALHEWRKERRAEGREAVAEARQVSGPSTELLRDEMRQVLEGELAALSEADRKAIQYRLEDHRPRPEVAARVGLTVKTLDRRLERILAGLRRALSRHFTTLVLSRSGRKITLADVEQLRPSFRRVFELRHLEGIPEERLPERLGAPLETVQARLRHAYERLGCRPADDFSSLQAEYRARVSGDSARTPATPGA